MAVEVTPKGTTGGSFPGGPVLRFFLKMNVGLYRLMHGGGFLKGTLLLTTTGARSGKQHTTPVAWFPDGQGNWLVIGSAGGAAKHPSWIFNLARNPDKVWIEVGDRKLKVTPQSLNGAERDAAYQRVVAKAANFGAYERKTDRVIPVVRLTPA